MKVIKLDEDNVRVVYGSLVNEMDIDWSMKYLREIRRLVEFAIYNFESQLPSLKKAKYKNLRVYEGGNHLDIIDNNVGTLNLLIVEDHFVG